jgi:signal transduction histidine kinase
MQKMFVRYISHEIRTPLNTVLVGLQVLEDSLRKQGQYVVANRDSAKHRVAHFKKTYDNNVHNNSNNNKSHSNNNISINSNNSNSDLETVQDMKLSCKIAIEILNDLLTYDKLQSGIMTLETTECYVTELLNEVMKPFYIQVECCCSTCDIIISSLLIMHFK